MHKSKKVNQKTTVVLNSENHVKLILILHFAFECSEYIWFKVFKSTYSNLARFNQWNTCIRRCLFKVYAFWWIRFSLIRAYREIDLTFSVLTFTTLIIRNIKANICRDISSILLKEMFEIIFFRFFSHKFFLNFQSMFSRFQSFKMSRKGFERP